MLSGGWFHADPAPIPWVSRMTTSRRLISIMRDGGGFGDPDALRQHLIEIDHARFKITQRANMRIALFKRGHWRRCVGCSQCVRFLASFLTSGLRRSGRATRPCLVAPSGQQARDGNVLVQFRPVDAPVAQLVGESTAKCAVARDARVIRTRNHPNAAHMPVIVAIVSVHLRNRLQCAKVRERAFRGVLAWRRNSTNLDLMATGA